MNENSFVTCSCGAEHWGKYGAAGLLVINEEDSTVLLQLRSEIVHHKNTWSIPGGALQEGESPMDAALREAREELGISSTKLRIQFSFRDDHKDWFYETFVSTTLEFLPTVILTEETSELEWVHINKVQSYDLHPNFITTWKQLHPLISRMLPHL